MFHKNVWRLVQFETLADLVNPELQAKVETAERFLLQNAHGILP